MGAGAEAVPALALVEVAQEDEEVVGGGLNVRMGGDAFAEMLEAVRPQAHGVRRGGASGGGQHRVGSGSGRRLAAVVSELRACATWLPALMPGRDRSVTP